MKNRIKITAISALVIFMMQGCKKDYLNRPPLASPTAGTFYANDNDILSGTGPLYNASWNSYNGTTMNAIGDVLGGNLVWDNYQGRGAYVNFSVSSTDGSGSLASAYNAFWSIVANANVVAYNIQNAAPGASAAGKNSGLAECRFMRAAAYYYLALNWGPVPIIYDNISQIGDKTIARNNLEDVWKFIISDLTWAKNNLSPTPLQPGRITKWSAEGMLARAYLVRSGLGQTGGNRKQADLDSAKFYAKDVCNNSGLSLQPNYYDLFTSKVFSGKNVPQECLFGLLWVPTGGWFVQNHLQANFAYDSKITQTGDGWGGSFGASSSLLQYYFDPANKADSVRRKASFFMPNDNYPDINQAAGGWHVDTGLFNHSKIYTPGASGNGDVNDHAYPKKYVIGSPSDNGGLGGSQNINMHTYIFRLSEVYLIYAESILGSQASTSDPEALKYFNLVRSRAGAPTKTSITFADIFLEKKVEFAFEGHTWYDWKQWYYFDPAKAIQYFSTQNRGPYNISYNNGNPFITFFGPDNRTPGTVTYAITSATADLPYPEAEKLVAPNLSTPPVPFDFGKLKY
ncbi:MAG TPA: RagB/SusD family nutrient uptake outer membrane protein [Chitinophagaceae bacterium]|nr:RagB/SusD family nutrient uptake outer membrane protein [Chitinophagaceae bacterium]